MTPSVRCWNGEFLSSAPSVHISPIFTAASSLRYVNSSCHCYLFGCTELTCFIVPIGLLHPVSVASALCYRYLCAVPHFWLNTYGPWAFSVAGPTVWNFLLDFIYDPMISADCYKRLLFVCPILVYPAQLGFLTIIVLYKSTYLLIY